MWQSVMKAHRVYACSTVGEACQKWSSLLQRPLGLYISLNDRVSGRAMRMNNAQHYSCGLLEHASPCSAPHHGRGSP